MTITLASNSFVTLEEYRQFTGLPYNQQGRIAASGSTICLNAAVDYIEEECRRTFLSGSLATDVFKGLGYNDVLDLMHDAYTPKEGPIVGTPVLEYRSSSAWTSVTDAWAVDTSDSDASFTYFTDGSYFVQDLLYRLRYEHGYTQSTIPSDLKAAQIIYARYLQMLGEHVGVSETSSENKSRSYKLNQPPGFIQQVINKYKRPETIMAMITHNFDNVQRMITRASRNLGPLVEDTLAAIGKHILRKVQLNLSGRVLQKRTGRLHDAWNYVIHPFGSKRLRLTIGAIATSVPYDEIHDKGGKAGRNHAVTIPGRRYYSRVPEESGAQINRIIGNKIKRLFQVMVTRTKAQWMDEFATQLQTLSTVATATRLTKSLGNAEKASPYIGLVSTHEHVQIEDNSDIRYISGVSLFILTKEQDTGIEEIIEDIKELIRTINLGDNVYQINFVGSSIVAVEDYFEEDGDKYSNTRVDLEVLWSHNFTTVSNPADSLTEPVATAHYKVYALLSSGSLSSQPLGTNVYPSHLTAAVSIPQGSGSILVGALTDSPYADSSGYSDSLMDQHRIQLVVDIPTAYAGGKANLNTNMRLVDDVVDKLRKNIDLGDYYKIVNDVPAFDVPSIVDELEESATIGSRIIVTVSRFYDYEQEG